MICSLSYNDNPVMLPFAGSLRSAAAAAAEGPGSTQAATDGKPQAPWQTAIRTALSAGQHCLHN